MNHDRTLPRTVEALTAALEASEARFQAIVDRSADGVLVVGQNGEILFANPAAEAILARPAGELLGEPFGIPIVPGLATELDVLPRGAAARTVEMRVVESVWQGRAAHLATLRDVTDRKRREEECREAIRRRDEFLAMLSHELRNPLAAVSSAAEVLLRRETDDPLLCRAREVVHRESRQMARLIDDLLDVCRISCGKAAIRSQTIDLAAIVREAGRQAEDQMRRRGLQFEIHGNDEPLWIEGDPVRLHQVIANLLTNASKYTASGGRVALRLSACDGFASICVEDTGIGIPAHELEQVFDPFFQGQVTLARSESGLGVGLSLVRGLIELHGGSVRAESEGPGRGSRFIVGLPLAPTAMPSTEPPPSSVPQSRDLRVLVVEDNPNGREMLKAVLECEGYHVETAPNGLRGLELIEFQRPDVALVDIGLPGIDGLEVARRVRGNPENDRVFLIALTGYGQPEDVQRALEAGFDVHLVKPLDPEQLAEIVHHRTRRRTP